MHREKGRGGRGHSGLENWKEQDVPRGDQYTLMAVWSPGWGFDSWLEGSPCAILRQSLPIAFRAAGVFMDGAAQAKRWVL